MCIRDRLNNFFDEELGSYRKGTEDNQDNIDETNPNITYVGNKKTPDANGTVFTFPFQKRTRSHSPPKNGQLFDTTRWNVNTCLLYTSPSPRDLSTSRMPSTA
eukprot:TRINITY_DN16970_c0_g1_i1.p4 TRINITY_DN16970_c0_g1~~TRINITY_DN16970_c0_g1_i1.p4  ORF type:complete len:110 (-),score=48.93 TRINITY_DN16970_c0_g1_i1:9-317(-)